MKLHEIQSNIMEKQYIKLNNRLDKYNNQQEYNDFIKLAKETLSKSIPLWTHFCEISPNKSWVVLPLLKDALFALDRYSELEEILNKLNEKFPENIEILLSLADYYSHKGEYDKSIEIIDKAIDKDENSYLAKLVDIKLRLEKDNNDQLSKKLDELINSLTRNERFQILNTSNDYSIMKLLFADNDK